MANLIALQAVHMVTVSMVHGLVMVQLIVQMDQMKLIVK